MEIIDSINEPSSKSIRAVCFDLGGVLVKINRNWGDALADAGFRSSIVGELNAMPEFESFQVKGVSEEEYLGALGTFLSLGDPAAALSVHNAILREPYEGTVELIELLHEHGIITGCLSNTNALHWEEMVRGQRFPNVAGLQHHLASQDLGLVKPSLAMFQAFEDVTKTRPSEIVFFDDTEEHVEAARERGWHAYWIDPEGDTAEQMELLLIAEGVLPI